MPFDSEHEFYRAVVERGQKPSGVLAFQAAGATHHLTCVHGASAMKERRALRVAGKSGIYLVHQTGDRLARLDPYPQELEQARCSAARAQRGARARSARALNGPTQL